MKRGYFVSPVLFISVFLIVFLMSFQFVRTDSMIAQAIRGESAVLKTIMTHEKAKLSAFEGVVPAAIYSASISVNQTHLGEQISNRLNGSGYLDTFLIVRTNNEFTVSGSFSVDTQEGGRSMEWADSFSNYVAYPVYTTYPYADLFTTNPINCSDMDNEIGQRILGIGLGPSWTALYSYDVWAGTTSIDLYLRDSNFPVMVDYQYIGNYNITCS